MSGIKSYINTHKDRFIDELIELLKIPSISADAAYSDDVHRAADAVKDSLIKIGVKTLPSAPQKDTLLFTPIKSSTPIYPQY